MCNAQYRLATVWSAPEVLVNLKKFPELTQQLDTYSFGMILWELWHEAVPFDNQVSQAKNFVVQEDARPKIITSLKDTHDSDEEGAEPKKTEQIALAEELTFCDETISNLIRKCWKKDPSQRPKFLEIC